MKRKILLFVALLSTLYIFGFPPNKLGLKATIKELNSYRKYYVKFGDLIDVRSSNREDNIYANAYIVGSDLMTTFDLYSDSNGIINAIYYNYNNITGSDFSYTLDTVLKLHKATFIKSDGQFNYYKFNLSRVSGYITTRYIEKDKFGLIAYTLLPY